MVPERRPDLTKILSQLRLITEMRNRIIHYGSFVTTDKGRVTKTARGALTPKGAQEHRASIEVLEAMTADVSRIYIALLWDMNPNRPSLSDPSLTEPWRYMRVSRSVTFAFMQRASNETRNRRTAVHHRGVCTRFRPQ
jgi:hypothetical protein